MKNFIKKMGFTLVISLIIISTLNVGCKKEEEDHGTAPNLPPQSSFVMDNSSFMDTSKAGNTKDSTYRNRNIAAWDVGVWNFLLTVTFAVPVASFVESFNHQAVWESTNTWKWSYSVPVGNITYTAKLIGKINGSQVDWEMYISKTGLGAYTDFKWYEGTSFSDHGTWTLNASPSNPTPFLGIEWHNNSNGTSDIKYINVVPNGAENGGFISYGKTLNAAYNVFYNIYNKGQNNLTEINWNSTSKEGQIKDSLFFHDTNFHCWNNLGKNVVCP